MMSAKPYVFNDEQWSQYKDNKVVRNKLKNERAAAIKKNTWDVLSEIQYRVYTEITHARGKNLVIAKNLQNYKEGTKEGATKKDYFYRLDGNKVTVVREVEPIEILEEVYSVYKSSDGNTRKFISGGARPKVKWVLDKEGKVTEEGTEVNSDPIAGYLKGKIPKTIGAVPLSRANEEKAAAAAKEKADAEANAEANAEAAANEEKKEADVDADADAPSLLSVLLSNDFTVPGYNYLGPGTNLEERVMSGKKPINTLDEIAYDHDYAYQAAGKLKDPAARKNAVKKADDAMIKAIGEQKGKMGFSERMLAYASVKALQTAEWAKSYSMIMPDVFLDPAPVDAEGQSQDVTEAVEAPASSLDTFGNDHLEDDDFLAAGGAMAAGVAEPEGANEESDAEVVDTEVADRAIIAESIIPVVPMGQGAPGVGALKSLALRAGVEAIYVPKHDKSEFSFDKWAYNTHDEEFSRFDKAEIIEQEKRLSGPLQEPAYDRRKIVRTVTTSRRLPRSRGRSSNRVLKNVYQLDTMVADTYDSGMRPLSWD